MRGRDAFATSFKTATRQFRIESSSDIQEIHVNGSWAYVWNYLRMTMTPIPDGPPRGRTGNVLSVLRKQANGAWVMFRDANLLAENSDS